MSKQKTQQTTTADLPVKPNDLDKSVIHTPEAVSRWKNEMFAYHSAIDQIETEKLKKEQAAQNYANRHLTSQEYFEQSVKRDKELRAKDAARQAEIAKAEKEKEEFLASNPPFVEILETTDYSFLKQFELWVRKGYVYESTNYFLPGCYTARMKAPECAQ